MKKLFSTLLVLLTVTALLFTGCSKPSTDQPGTTPAAPSESGTLPSVSAEESTQPLTEEALSDYFSNRDLSGEYDAASATALDPNGDLTITAAGTYLLSGSYTGQITVSVGKEEKVQLVLNGADITNESGPAIYIQSGDKIFLTAAEGTENRISDGSDYSATDGTTKLDGAIFSKSDLTINGSGSLTVTGNNKHGIVSKDDLIITVASLAVTAKNVGLNGKDCVKIGNAEVTVNAGTDGIRSDNEEDSARGYIYAAGSAIAIEAGKDGIQAETWLTLDSTNVSMRTGGGYTASSYDSSESYKGLKAGTALTVNGGTYALNCLDDALHAQTVTVTAGTFTITTGDDGMHADGVLTVSGGDVNILTCYEGLEGSTVNVSGGTIRLSASDDGLNAVGDDDSSTGGMGGFFGFGGQDPFSSGNGEIHISGGYLWISANGDGIDVNGTLNISGGVVLVSGPTNDGNGALDYDSACNVTGGVLIALGSAGMAQGVTSAENQGAISLSLGSQSEGTAFSLCDESGKVLVSFTPGKAYSTAVVTAPGIQAGSTYTVVLGGTVQGADENGYAENTAVSGGTTAATVEMTSTLYSGLNGGMGGFGGPGGGMGGFGGGMGGQPGGGFGGGQGGFGGGQGGPGGRP